MFLLYRIKLVSLKDDTCIPERNGNFQNPLYYGIQDMHTILGAPEANTVLYFYTMYQKCSDHGKKIKMFVVYLQV